MKKIGVLFVIILLLTICSSCKGDKITIKTNDSTINVEQNNKSITVEDENGSIIKAGKDVPLPDGYPVDKMPLYNKEVVYVAAVIDDNSYSVAYTSSSNPEDIVAYYKDILKNTTGFTELNTQGSFFLSGLVDNCGYTVSISENNPDETNCEGTSQVLISIYEQ